MAPLSWTYRRPSYVSSNGFRLSQSSLGGSEKESLGSGKLRASKGIPPALTFENIMSGMTCEPMSLSDFMKYLLYIEHSAENLQFYLWYQDYVKRFEATPASDIKLAPEWTREMETAVAAKLQKQATETSRNREKAAAAAAEMFKGTGFDTTTGDALELEVDPFSTPPPSADGSHPDDDTVSFAPSSQPSSAPTYRSQASEAFVSVGAATPFTIQPFREEISRIISTYIADGAPRQLNLSGRDRKALLHALSYTTHPSALRTAIAAAEAALRRQAHPNFVRWSVANGNPPRISFARTAGLLGLLGASLAALLLTLSRQARAWRLLALIGWLPGIWAVAASYSGMCICMYALGRGRQHVRPWDLFEDAEGGSPATAGLRHRSFDSFGSGNSFETEPWVVRYEEQGLVRKIFDRETWIQEAALRQIQDTIFVQALVVGLLVSGVLTAVFVPLPAGNFF